MPVTPMYGGGNGGGFGSFGNDGWWIILLLLCFGNNGWGGGFGGGGNAQLGYDFPWLLNGQNNINANTNNGFRDAMINDGITSIRDGISGLSTQLCGCCSDMQMALANGFAGVEQGANTRQMANMQQAFAAQAAITSGMNDLAMSLQNCCCENRAGIADLKYTVATENCADRTQAMQNTRDIIDSQTRGTQAIIDKLCQLELDGVKAQVEAKNDRIAELQTQLNMANLAASQTAQNAFIAQGFSNEVDQLYNRLSNCPIPSVPVYGKQNIFTCNQNNGCGCGCGCGM
ncbi:MAG: hypothetical protein K6F28_10035 [Lachnospiraceae bacterium]|nr:hypothetical protein [Lachnospiraceae bacterium]